jgi:hypothetical protein
MRTKSWISIRILARKTEPTPFLDEEGSEAPFSLLRCKSASNAPPRNSNAAQRPYISSTYVMASAKESCRSSAVRSRDKLVGQDKAGDNEEYVHHSHNCVDNAYLWKLQEGRVQAWCVGAICLEEELVVIVGVVESKHTEGGKAAMTIEV